MIVVGVGVLGVVAGATIGPTVGEILFGDKFNLGNLRPRRCSSSAARAFILALTLAQALIALLGPRPGADRVDASGWCSAWASWRSAARPPSTTCSCRVELGYLAGCLGAAAMMAVFLLLPPAHAGAREPQPRSSRPSSTSRSRSDPGAGR